MNVSLEQIEFSEPLQVAITNSLNTIDVFVSQKTKLLVDDAIYSDLVSSCSGSLGSKIVVMPRTFVVSAFSEKIVNEFKENYEGSSYADLFNEILKSSAIRQELAYFSDLNISEAISQKHILVGKDSMFNWGEEEIKGHYYIESYILEPRDKEAIDGCLSLAKDMVGRKTKDSMREIMETLSMFAT